MTARRYFELFPGHMTLIQLSICEELEKLGLRFMHDFGYQNAFQILKKKYSEQEKTACG